MTISVWSHRASGGLRLFAKRSRGLKKLEVQGWNCSSVPCTSDCDTMSLRPQFFGLTVRVILHAARQRHCRRLFRTVLERHVWLGVVTVTEREKGPGLVGGAAFTCGRGTTRLGEQPQSSLLRLDNAAEAGRRSRCGPRLGT